MFADQKICKDCNHRWVYKAYFKVLCCVLKLNSEQELRNSCIEVLDSDPITLSMVVDWTTTGFKDVLLLLFVLFSFHDLPRSNVVVGLASISSAVKNVQVCYRFKANIHYLRKNIRLPKSFLVNRYEREEAFHSLQVTVKSCKLEDSLEQFVNGEILEGDNAYFCEKCNERVSIPALFSPQDSLICFAVEPFLANVFALTWHYVN